MRHPITVYMPRSSFDMFSNADYIGVAASVYKRPTKDSIQFTETGWRRCAKQKPPVGLQVWIEFDDGARSYGVWNGQYWLSGEKGKPAFWHPLPGAIPKDLQDR